MMADNVIPLDAWRGRLQQGEKGVKRNLTNLMLHLQNIDGLGKSLRFNEMTYQAEWRGRPMRDSDLIDIRLLVERAGFQPIDKDVKPAVERVALDNAYNPVVDYLDALVWDGKPRLIQWMQKLLGAPDTAFVRSIGPKTLIAAVARAREPGCKVDTVLVLEGEQGIRKSSAIAALFGEDYTAESVSLFDQHNKMVMQMMGAWVVELAEFVAIARKDHGSVKGLLSMRADRVVLPYAKLASTHPRRCVFFGTINPEDFGYLTDTTGNRRYWPVNVTRIDIDAIREHRDQLWAEAQQQYRDGKPWWLAPEEEADAETQTAQRAEVDPWEEILAEKLAGRHEVTPLDAMKAIGILNERMDRRAQMRVAMALKALGYRGLVTTKGGKPLRIWRKSDA
jgi:predicted P-loop ATPase